MLPFIYRGHDDPGFLAHALSLSADANPLEILPSNQRIGGARYACMIIVKDYFRMRAGTANGHEWHYSQLEPVILEDVRAGRAVLVFDLCNEGPAYEPNIFSELYDWIERQHLPAGRCIWLAQNRLIGASARSHVGERARLVRFECYDYFVKIMAWIFSPISPNDMLGIDPDAYVGRMFDVTQKDRLLLCLNATPRLPRVLTVAALRHHRLLDASVVSFPGMNYVKSGASLEEVWDFVEHNPGLDYLRDSLADVARMPPLKADAFPDLGNELVEKIDPYLYQRTFFSLVTESDFVDQHIQRVTEKTVKAFCLGHPTLVVGNPHSIALMTDYGFQDWRGSIDRRAESEQEPAARFELVMKEVLRLASQIEADPAAWLGGVREVGSYNFRRAVNGIFLDDFVKRIDRGLVDLLLSLVSH